MKTPKSGQDVFFRIQHKCEPNMSFTTSVVNCFQTLVSLGYNTTTNELEDIKKVL